MIVSAAGFYNSAKTKADHLGIRCLDLEEVESFDWLLAPGINVVTKRLLRTDWTFVPEQDGVVEKGNFEIVDKDGNVATMAILTANAQKQLSKLLPEMPEPVEEAKIVVRFPDGDLILRNQTTGETVAVKFSIARISYSVTSELIPFRLVQYKETNKGESITDAAYADLSLGKQTARLLIAYKENEGGKIVIGPQP